MAAVAPVLASRCGRYCDTYHSGEWGVQYTVPQRFFQSSRTLVSMGIIVLYVQVNGLVHSDISNRQWLDGPLVSGHRGGDILRLDASIVAFPHHHPVSYHLNPRCQFATIASKTLVAVEVGAATARTSQPSTGSRSTYLYK